MNNNEYVLKNSILLIKNTNTDKIVCQPELILGTDDCVQIINDDLIIEWNKMNVKKDIDFKNIVYVYYLLKDREFIIPIHMKSQCDVIKLYKNDDIETCRSYEYDNITTLYYNNDEICELIHKYAGPKGNFYSDIDQIKVNTADLYFFNYDSFSDICENHKQVMDVIKKKPDIFAAQNLFLYEYFGNEKMGVVQYLPVLNSFTDILSLRTMFDVQLIVRYGKDIKIESEF